MRPALAFHATAISGDEVFLIYDHRGMQPAWIRFTTVALLDTARFDAGILMGGVEGVEEEFELFLGKHPDALVLPVASIGATAGMLFERCRERLHLPQSLADDHAYPSLFRELLELP